MAAGLQNLHGLDPNDVQRLPRTPTCLEPQIAPVVLIQLPNCLPFATIAFGTLAAGLTATLVSPALTSAEIAWVLQNARPRVIITANACLAAMKDGLRAQEDRDFFGRVPVYTVDVAGDQYPSNSADQSSQDWKRLLTLPTTSITKPRDFDAKKRTAIILWSSGTSGKSKGVLLSHHALNFSIASLWHDADFFLGQRQRWLAFVPFFHVFGLLNLFLIAIPTGSTVYVMSTFKPDVMLHAVQRRAITYLHMAPPIAVMLAKSPAVAKFANKDAHGRNGFSSVIGAITGGAPLGHDVVRQVFERLGFRIRLGYGLTEACSVTLQRGLTRDEMEMQAGSTGLPHWGVELMIVNGSQQTAKASAVREPGEVLVRSPGLLSSYLPIGGLATGATGDMTATEEALTADGWFRTGDVGTITPEGGLVITDRIKELIKVRAFQVAPAELEAILCSSDEVADAGVVGVYDGTEATEWPRAFIVPASGVQQTEADLRALAHRVRELVEGKTARYKWLRGGVVFVKQIPKSPSGKILRRLMRQGMDAVLEVDVYPSGSRARAKL